MISETWELDSIFEGGSESEALQSFLTKLEQDISTLQSDIQSAAVPKTDEDAKAWSHLFERLQEAVKRVREASAYTSCLSAQNTKDKKAIQLRGNLNQLSTTYASLMISMDEIFVQIPQKDWETFVGHETIHDIAFALTERRLHAQEKLSPPEEKLAQQLAVDGYHGWGAMYNTLVGKMSISMIEDGKEVSLSVGQAENKMNSGDREVRKAAFDVWEKAWSKEEDIYATTINHLAGFRINLYKQRQWDDVLKEPLDINRMSRQTLDTMWNTITVNKPALLPFLERKARLLGVEKLAWHDVLAPLGQVETEISYESAAAAIQEQFARFSPQMANFAKMAFDERWIEVEDRTNKRPGGFCTSFPVSQQSRIFMTYDKTPSNVATLAHELGHAYHQYVMNDMPQFSQFYAMNVAETASTFAEMIVADASVKSAVSKEDKITLLESKIGSSIAYFMNIHARFLFETRFYEQRKKGLLTADDCNKLMLEAQQEAFCDSLSEYHPHFWAAKLHFHITGVPFYNFPYTFGYLFSMGVYAHAMESGKSFENDYINLLRDTGRMHTEELAKKHLNVDLTAADFWQKAIDLVIADVEEFNRLTD